MLLTEMGHQGPKAIKAKTSSPMMLGSGVLWDGELRVRRPDPPQSLLVSFQQALLASDTPPQNGWQIPQKSIHHHQWIQNLP